MTTDSNNPLSIAHAAAPQDMDSGDFVYRVRQPDAATAALPGVQAVSFTTVSTHRDRLLRDADVLVLQMIGDPDLLPVILERVAQHRLTVYEISDNFLAFQPGNPAAAFYADPANRACIMQLASLCHAVQFTMPELERRFAFLNPHRAVFMNQAAVTGTPDRARADVVTIGWGGSLGHLHDMQTAAPHIVKFVNSRDNVRLALMASSKITALFREIPDHKKAFTPTGSLHDYYAFVQSLDIGIAPMLAVDDFNACRSDVKFMEYASHGVVPVCSAAPPYVHTVRHGDTGFIFTDIRELPTLLDSILDDPQAMRRVAHNAFDYVRRERTPHTDARKRLDFYTGLIRDMDLATRGFLYNLDSVPGASKAPGSEHWLVRFDKVEKLLHDGLAAQFRNRDHALAARLLNEACELAPDFYPAHLYQANAYADRQPGKALESLERAMKCDPAALAAPTLAARLLAAGGHKEQALAIARAVAERVPQFAPARALAGDILREASNTEQAAQAYRAALESNPFFSPAATQAGTMFLESDRPEQARPLFESALLTADHISVNHIGLGAVLFQLGEQEAASRHMLRALKRDPSAAPAAAFLIEITRGLNRNKQWDKTIELLEPAHALRPRDMEIALLLARALESSGRARQAQITWRHIAEKDPDGNYARMAAGKLTQESPGSTP